MTVNFAHCLFEQSGTFKRAFEDLGIHARDYDIENRFEQTDWRGDLFAEIENAFKGKPSIFDYVAANDLLLVFFPCTYFCENNMLFFMGANVNYRGLTQSDKVLRILQRADERHACYVRLLELCYVCESRGLRAIIENPYNAHHYLRFNFPYKPAVIDMNRRRSGDFFPKPTQYIFVNCTPAGKRSVQMDKERRFVRKERGINRSLISYDYAHNFICDHILGIESGHTEPTLF